MRIWSSDELVAHTFRNAYLIDPIVPRGGIVLFHGKRGIGKTQFLLTVAACLNEGGTLFGRYRTRPSNVFYIQADMTPQIQQLRVKQAQLLYPLARTHFIFPSFFNISTLREEAELVQTVRSLEPDLVVWDTLRKIHRGDSNVDDTASFVYGRAKELFPTATHCFVHHDKKTIAEQEKLEEEELYRGSGAWLDDADTGLHLKAIGTGRMILTFTKTRTAALQQSISLAMHGETLLLYASYSSGSSLAETAERWTREHRRGSKEELERHLLSSFVASPRAIRQYIHGDSNE